MKLIFFCSKIFLQFFKNFCRIANICNAVWGQFLVRFLLSDIHRDSFIQIHHWLMPTFSLQKGVKKLDEAAKWQKLCLRNRPQMGRVQFGRRSDLGSQGEQRVDVVTKDKRNIMPLNIDNNVIIYGRFSLHSHINLFYPLYAE
jgi:hypothetical protein